jgi:hypothetical protein
MSETSAPASPVVVVDLGKHKRKSIKKLRKGEGRLLDEVNALIDELREAGTVGEGAQPVVIVVKEKDRAGGLPIRGLLR